MFISAVDFDILGRGSGDWFTFGARDHLSNCSFGTSVLAPFFSPGGCTSRAVHSFRFLSSFNISTFHSPSWFLMNHFSFFKFFSSIVSCQRPCVSFDRLFLFWSFSFVPPFSISFSVIHLFFLNLCHLTHLVCVVSLWGCIHNVQSCVLYVPKTSRCLSNTLAKPGINLSPVSHLPRERQEKEGGGGFQERETSFSF